MSRTNLELTMVCINKKWSIVLSNEEHTPQNDSRVLCVKLVKTIDTSEPEPKS